MRANILVDLKTVLADIEKTGSASEEQVNTILDYVNQMATHHSDKLVGRKHVFDTAFDSYAEFIE